MNLINTTVEHILYGSGFITDVSEHVIWVRFQKPYGVKAFLFPEAFEKYLKAMDSEAEQGISEALRIKKEQAESEKQRKYKEHEEEIEAAKQEIKLQRVRKKPAVRPKRKIK